VGFLSDAKFRMRTYERLVDCVRNAATGKRSRLHLKPLDEDSASAKDISDKYVHPPHSTDFAVLFLPTEGLFAEIY